MSPILQQPFFQVTLPIVVTFVATIWLASWSQNKRLDEILRRLERIESKMDDHETRITRVEERTSPLARR